MESRLINRIELSFWNVAIPAMSRSRFLRKSLTRINKAGGVKAILFLVAMLVCGSALGLLTGTLLRTIF